MISPFRHGSRPNTASLLMRRVPAVRGEAYDVTYVSHQSHQLRVVTAAVNSLS